jgi:hypothetical protein
VALTCTFVCVCVCADVCVFLCVWVSVCVWLCVYVCGRSCVVVCVCVHVWLCVFACGCVVSRVCLCVCFSFFVFLRLAGQKAHWVQALLAAIEDRATTAEAMQVVRISHSSLALCFAFWQDFRTALSEGWGGGVRGGVLVFVSLIIIIPFAVLSSWCFPYPRRLSIFVVGLPFLPLGLRRVSLRPVSPFNSVSSASYFPFPPIRLLLSASLHLVLLSRPPTHPSCCRPVLSRPLISSRLSSASVRSAYWRPIPLALVVA